MYNNDKINKIIFVLLSSLLLFSGLGKVFGEGNFIGGVNKFDLRIIENGFFNWIITPIFSRLFISLEIILGCFLFTKWIKNKVIFYALSFVIFFYLLDIILGWNNLLSKDYNLLFLFSPLLSLAFLPILILGLIILYNTNYNIKNSFWSLVIIIPIVSLIFITNPLFIEDFENNSNNYTQNTEDWNIISKTFNKKGININKGNYIITFLSTNCLHCNELAKSIGVTKRGLGTSKDILMVFPGNKKNTINFIKRNKSNFNYIIIKPEEFTKVAGFSFPSIFSIKDGKVIKHWTGYNFGFKVRYLEL